MVPPSGIHRQDTSSSWGTCGIQDHMQEVPTPITNPNPTTPSSSQPTSPHSHGRGVFESSPVHPTLAPPKLLCWSWRGTMMNHSSSSSASPRNYQMKEIDFGEREENPNPTAIKGTPNHQETWNRLSSEG